MDKTVYTNKHGVVFTSYISGNLWRCDITADDYMLEFGNHHDYYADRETITPESLRNQEYAIKYLLSWEENPVRQLLIDKEREVKLLLDVEVDLNTIIPDEKVNTTQIEPSIAQVVKKKGRKNPYI